MHSLTLFAGGNEPIDLLPLEDFKSIVIIKKDSKLKAKRDKDRKETKRKFLRSRRNSLLLLQYPQFQRGMLEQELQVHLPLKESRNKAKAIAVIMLTQRSKIFLV